MADGDGNFIWYELMTPDVGQARAFYGAVLGWTIDESGPGPMDYRMIGMPDGYVGGVLPLTDAMIGGGARPGWYGYLGVADLDAKLAAITGAGGAVIMPPTDVPGTGRFALIADPQGVVLYLMQPDAAMTGQESTAFSPSLMGRCTWNELATPDQGAALAFYGAQFGWEASGTMAMGPMGDYSFITKAGVPIGAVMTAAPGFAPPAWRFNFRVADLGAAGAAVTAGGGIVQHGPVDVPGGERVIIATDPQGAGFGLVCRG